MTLAEHLAQTGILLDREIGLIAESADKNGVWRTQETLIARIHTAIPDDAQQYEEVQNYDPQYDLALLWEMHGEARLYILSMTDGSILYAVKDGGLIIASGINRVRIGQSDSFMQSVCEAQRALAAPLH